MTSHQPPEIIRVFFCPKCGNYETRPGRQPVWCPRCLTPNPIALTFTNSTLEPQEAA